MTQVSFKTLYLPDGQLLSYAETYTVEGDRKFCINMALALYENDESATRRVYELTFEHIISASKTHYFRDHHFHIGAGNVSHGYVVDEHSYVFILADGVIDINARKLTIKHK